MAYSDTNTVAPQDGQIRMNEALRDWLRTHTPVQTKPNPNKKTHADHSGWAFCCRSGGVGLYTHLNSRLEPQPIAPKAPI